MNSTADGGYAAQIQTSGTHVQVGYCPITGEARGWTSTNAWDGAATSDPDIPAIILDTDDQGRTFFTPWYGVNMPMGNVTANCGDDASQQDPGSTMLTFVLAPGDPRFSDNPLPDSDPDPLHLVGQREWAIGDWPATPTSEFIDWEEYTFTVTYDLHLVDDPCVVEGAATDIRRAKPERAPEETPDLLSFDLQTEWCVKSSGQIIVDLAAANGSTLLTPFEAALGATFDVLFDVRDRWSTTIVEEDHGEYTTVTATGKWRECFGMPIPLKPKQLGKLADVFRHAAKQSDRPKVASALLWVADKLDKARRALDDGIRWVAKRILDGIAVLIDALPARQAIYVTNLIFQFGIDYADSGEWAQDYISPNVGIQKLLYGEHCTTKWKPRIVTTIYKDGHSRSDYVNLDGDYPWNVRP